MLRTLRVRDLAIIEELELVLEPGLNVITGETGAGKSILLQALDVALGGRPDADLVRTGAEEGVVEALFSEVPDAVRERLVAAGMPADDGAEVVIRRVIASGGRTRAFVNGALGSLALLRDLAPHLLHVYGQDEHQALRRVESHRELLDTAGGLGRTLEEMRARWERVLAAREALRKARADGAAAVERAEMLRAQAEELVRAGLVLGEEDALAAERSRLVHAERLASLAAGAEETLYSGEGAVIEGLGRALGAVREAVGLDATLEPTRALLESALAELEEAGSGLGRYARELTPDPARLEAVEERLAQLARLRRKYSGTVEDLVRRRDELVAEVAQLEGGGEAVAELEAAVETMRRSAAEWAGRLSVERRRVARDLTRALRGELEALALEGARFEVRFAEAEGHELGAEGWDEVEFFLSTNAGEETRSLARVASGGELSRIMLALKTLAAADARGATLIFDEVDAGIGGAVAEVVGRKLRQLGRARQVLCITHLPLIAAFAEHHVAVAKRVEDGRTLSSARPLSTSERVAELARMLGGTRLTPEVREHAAQLLQRAQGPSRGLTERAGVE
jgi:DNA repair protein RecN (Recombination protein N)